MLRLFESGAYSRMALVKKFDREKQKSFKNTAMYLNRAVFRNCSLSVSKAWCVKFDTFIRGHHCMQIKLENWNVRRKKGKRQVSMTRTMVVFIRNHRWGIYQPTSLVYSWHFLRLTVGMISMPIWPEKSKRDVRLVVPISHRKNAKSRQKSLTLRDLAQLENGYFPIISYSQS